MERLEGANAREEWRGEVLSYIKQREEEKRERVKYSEEELLSEIRKKWLKVLDELKNGDKIVFAYFRGAEPVRVSFEDSSVRVFFRHLDVSFIEYVEDPKIKDFIQKVFQKVLGLRLPISCALESRSWETVREEEI
ncbi:MAG: hypothetical protein J7M13_01570 [Synergistetes bacterium]|nr:hypothetical protein [Synergistota bacterium]